VTRLSGGITTKEVVEMRMENVEPIIYFNTYFDPEEDNLGDDYYYDEYPENYYEDNAIDK